MPRVAVAENVVGLAEPSQARFQAVDNGGGALGGIASGLAKVGDVGVKLAEQEAVTQHIYNEAAAKQAYAAADDQVRSILYTGDKAFYLQQGADAIGAKQPTMDALAKVRSDAYSSLKNPQQQRMFADAFDARLGEEQKKIAVHADQEVRAYGTAQSQARQVGAQNNALDNVDNPELYGKFMATGEGEIAAQGRLAGWPAEVVAEKQAEFRSGTVARAVDAKMTADPVGAAAWADKHSDILLPGDRAKLSASLYQPLLERRAAADVDGLMHTNTGALSPVTPAPATGGAPLARMVAITAFSESRGRDRDASGKLITSPAGAQGIMQVMPATARDPGFGVRPAQDGSDEERARVGRDVLAAMMKRYDGDPAKAWAAYNAGPGRVDKLTAQYGDGWLAHAPAETRAYVATNTAMLGQQGQTFAPRRDDLNGLYAAIDAQPWDYERKKAARADLDQRVARDDHLQQRAQKDAQDAAYTVMNRLGDGFTSINQLPPSVRMGLSPEAMHSMIETAKQNAAPKAVAANGDRITSLHQLAALQPDAFTQRDLRQDKPYMTPAEYDSLATTQAQMLAKPAKQTEFGKIWSAASFYGRDAGVDMSAQKKGESNDDFHARQADGTKLFNMMKSELDVITDGKRPATDQEIKAAADRALIYRSQTATQRAWGDHGYHATPFFREAGVTPSMVAVPSSERPKIIAALRGAGQPTDEQTIARFWLRHAGGQ